MNCTDWEERIALYAGGDLDPRRGAALERHLAECPGCQLFASGLAESLDIVKAAHGETIAPAHYTALRARVLAAVDRDRRRWRWLWASAALAAAAVALIVVGLRMRIPELAPLAQSNALRNAPPAQQWQMAYTKPAATRPQSPRRTHAPHPREQVLVKVETDNPDVVIFWIAETQGEN